MNDEKDNKWYRASLEAEESGPFCRMLYVDRGLKTSVNVSNIYRLEMLSVALSRYPAQAIRLRMFDIPEITDYLLSRMRVLLKPGLTAMVSRIMKYYHKNHEITRLCIQLYANPDANYITFYSVILCDNVL